MTPEQIDIVQRSWRAALGDVQLPATIAGALSGSPNETSTRATWIVDTVSALSALLNQPGQFSELAERVLARRVGVTIEELAEDREALLAAIRTKHPSGRDERERIERAWTLAIQLFGEIVTAACLDPFNRTVAADGAVGIDQSPQRLRTGRT